MSCDLLLLRHRLSLSLSLSTQTKVTQFKDLHSNSYNTTNFSLSLSLSLSPRNMQLSLSSPFVSHFPSLSLYPNMNSATSKTPPLQISPPFSFLLANPSSRLIQSKRGKQDNRKLFFKSVKCNYQSDSNTNFKSNFRNPNFFSVSGKSEVDNKLQNLVMEFKSLSEPIDRVKRLLHYASLLSPFDDGARVSSNRITGCAVQVWLEVRMDTGGLMRFRADSDSEIAKGFCWCLIWMLDGAAPEEVLRVKAEDLAEMNVGLNGRAHSRVNTWHNALIGMQKRTRDLVAEEKGKPKDQAGAYQMSNEGIGCLADASATPPYLDFFQMAITSTPSLHLHEHLVRDES